MNTINTLSTQLRDLFQSMTPGARITAGLLLAVVVMSMGFLFQQGTASPDEYLFGGEPLSMSQLGRMEAAISEAGLSGWEVESNRIRVPQGKKDAYIAAIASGGALPPDFSSIMNEAIAKASPLESRHQWELRTKAAREAQLSHLISAMPWVEQANVMFEIEERRGFGRKNQASASIFVVPRNNESLSENRVRNLQVFVAGTMTSLSPAGVNVTSGGEDSYDADQIVMDDPFLLAREKLQQSYRQRILRGLNYIPGIRVEVSGTVDNTQQSKTFESTPGEPKEISSTSDIEEAESGLSATGGRPGQIANSANGPGRNDSLARENRTKTRRETTSSNSMVGESRTEEIRTGFQIKEMYASVNVPRDYIVKVWQQRNPDAAREDQTQAAMDTLESEVRSDVENFVENILPRLSLGEDEFNQVKVVFFDTLERDPLPEPSMTDNAMVWAGQYWGTLSMIGLAMFSLLMLRSVVRSDGKGDTSPSSMAIELETTNLDASESGDEETDLESTRPKLRLKKGDSLKEDLSEMVLDNPEAAAAILRTWIGNAG